MEVIVIDRAAFNQGANAQYLPHIERTQVLCPCLRARQYKDPPIVVMRAREDER